MAESRGFLPARMKGAGANTKGINAYAVANAYGTALFKGDPVKVSAGVIVRAANGDKVQGVFMGCSYIDANGQPKQDAYLPASTSINAKPIDAVNGLSQPVAYVLDDPNATFLIAADSSLSAGEIGLNFRVSIGTGSTVTKQSAANLVTASATTSGVDATSADAQTMVRLIGLHATDGNDLGDANPLVEVKFIAHADSFTNA